MRGIVFFSVCQVDKRAGDPVRHLILVAWIHFFKYGVIPFSHEADAP